MVFFVCGACGDSFKRKQAENHTFRCRNWSFSCMDCNRDFEGKSFVQHNQCMTESEKLFGSYHVAKAGKDKNEAHMERLRTNLSNRKDLKPFHQRIINRLIALPSIPRKEQKFVNFVRTSMNLNSAQVINELWEIVQRASIEEPTVDKENVENGDSETAKEPEVAEKKTTTEIEQNGEVKKTKKRKMKSEEVKAESSDEEEEPEKKVKLTKSQKKKRKLASATEEPDAYGVIKQTVEDDDLETLSSVQIDTVEVSKKFKWRKAIKEILREGPSEGMKLNKLLGRIEMKHNHPLTGVQYKLDRDTLKEVMMKTLSKKPFSIANNRARLGKVKTN